MCTDSVCIFTFTNRTFPFIFMFWPRSFLYVFLVEFAEREPLLTSGSLTSHARIIQSRQVRRPWQYEQLGNPDHQAGSKYRDTVQIQYSVPLLSVHVSTNRRVFIYSTAPPAIQLHNKLTTSTTPAGIFKVKADLLNVYLPDFIPFGTRKTFPLRTNL